nr:class D sortase [Sedimentibacter sp.]
MLKKYFRYIPYILIASGVIIIAVAVISRLMTIYYQNQYIKNYEKYISELKNSEEQDVNTQNNLDDKITSDKNIVMPKVIINPDDVKNNETEIKKTEEPAMIGTIKIPKINIYTAILEGTDNNALRYTVGHYPQTAGPGEKGNFVLLGHRNYRYGKFFKKLDELEIGDEVIVKKDTNTYTYVVTNSFVVSPEDTWVLRQTSDAQITMITCTPIGTYTHRLVVKGVLIE